MILGHAHAAVAGYADPVSEECPKLLYSLEVVLYAVVKLLSRKCRL